MQPREGQTLTIDYMDLLFIIEHIMEYGGPNTLDELLEYLEDNADATVEIIKHQGES